MRVKLVHSFTFESAHFLPSFPDGHKCRRMHGHSFRADVVVEGDIPAGRYHLIDYGDIKAIVDPIHARIDHNCLNEIAGLENPTSEMIAVWLWEQIHPKLPLLKQINVYETCTSKCEYHGPNAGQRA